MAQKCWVCLGTHKLYCVVRLIGLFVCFLMTDVIHRIPIAFCLLCFRLEKFSLLLPHSRCNLLHFSGFFAISISFRFCRYLVYQFILFLITGVISNCYTFSLKLLLSPPVFPLWEVHLFVCFLMADVIHCVLNYFFYIQEILPGTIALAFHLAFACRHLVYCFVIITGVFCLFTITLFIANFALVFPAWDVLYLLLAHGRCFLLLCCCGLSRRHFNTFVFPSWEVLLFVCSLMVDVIHCIFATFYTTEFTWYNSFSFSLCFY